MPSNQENKSVSPQAITIDGPAGAGKSTVAKALAKKLNFFYLDTGAMYRALTLKIIQSKIALDNEGNIIDLALKTEIDFETHQGADVVLLDGKDVSQEIRTVEVTKNTYFIARIPKVREIIVDKQRQIGKTRNIVIEGRDTGTVVFPKAKVKFFLDASLDIRSIRRTKDLKDAGKTVSSDEVKQEIKQRDHSDETRTAGPLLKARDAVYIDTTNMIPEQTVERLLKHVRATWINR